jgi:S-adenosylmethionine synthetase
MARHIAKNVVAAELAKKCEVQLAYAIGVAEPVSVLVDTFSTGQIDEDRIREIVTEVYDLRPAAIIEYLDLLQPVYARTSAYGHFGRNEPGFTWEQISEVEAIQKAA